MEYCCNIEERRLAQLQAQAETQTDNVNHLNCHAGRVILLRPTESVLKCCPEKVKCCKKQELPQTFALCEKTAKKTEKKCCRKNKHVYPDTILLCLNNNTNDKTDLTSCHSRELRGGTLYTDCFCDKKYGLQDNCPRSGCHGSPKCLTKPKPTCCPSQKCHVSRWEKKFPNIRCGRNLDDDEQVITNNQQKQLSNTEPCFLAFFDNI